jgi:hypothetical protein
MEFLRRFLPVSCLETHEKGNGKSAGESLDKSMTRSLDHTAHDRDRECITKYEMNNSFPNHVVELGLIQVFELVDLPVCQVVVIHICEEVPVVSTRDFAKFVISPSPPKPSWGQLSF